MDTREYLDLYLAESREHLRELSAGILRLEEEGRGPALEACFRAAHTLKGMSAAMGFEAAAGAAHRLEDILSAVRAGGLDLDASRIDELLALSDELERAVEAASGGSTDAVVAPPEEVSPERPSEFDLSAAALVELDDVSVPEGGELSVRILMEPTAPLKAARALLLQREIAKVAPVLWTLPAELDDDFDGDLRIGLAEETDREAVETAIRRAGEVRAFHWQVDERQAGPTAEEPGVRRRAAREGRHVRVERRHLDALAEGIGELAVLHGHLIGLAGEEEDDLLRGAAERLGRTVDDLQAAILSARMIPVEAVFDRFPRVVRDTARKLGKDVELVMEGRGIRLDRAILEEIHDPLLHLLRNAVDHGVESPEKRRAAGKPPRGRLLIRAERERAGVLIRVEDDGAGIARKRVLERARREGLVPRGREALADEELLRLLGRPGFSLAEHVTELSGRGVGMDVVLDRVRAMGGSIGVETEEGRGTAFAIRLPLSLALAQALRVRLGGEEFLVPLTHVTEVVELNGNVERVRGGEVLRVREEAIPLTRLAERLGSGPSSEGAAVLHGTGERRRALAVDALLGREQVVVRPFEGPRGTLPCFAGVTLLGDGRPALVLDPTGVL